jgi:hypothetical protein
MLININGQNYSTWDEVPDDIKQKVAAKLPDADGNGIPDVFEGNLSSLGNLAAAAAASGQPATTSFSTIVVDGQQVNSLGQLPPEIQEMLQKTLGIYQPGSVAAPPGTPGAPAQVAPGAAVPPNASWPIQPGAQPATPPVTQPGLQPGQVMLNGVPTVVGETAPPKKGFFRRLFGG